MSLNWYKKLKWYEEVKRVRQVMFICSGNVTRSTTAEFTFNSLVSWWGRLKAISRGINVSKIRAKLESLGIPPDLLMMEDEVIKTLGIKVSKGFKPRVGVQVTEKDMMASDLILTMEKSQRDLLKKEYKDQAYKIFTLKGFVDQNDNLADDRVLDFSDPFIVYPERAKYALEQGKIAWRLYLKEHIDKLSQIQDYVRDLIKILYLLKQDRK